MSIEQGPLSPPPAANATGGASAASAPVVCPNCGTANPPGMRFCGNCGTRLAPPEDSAPVASGDAPAPAVAPAAPTVPAPAPTAVPVAPQPTITIPTDPIARERERDRLLTLANVQRMRGQIADARGTLANVLVLMEGAPGKDQAPVHELIGDLFASEEKWEEAQKAFGTAHTLDPGRAAAEKKFAQATLRISDAQAMKTAMASGNLAGMSDFGNWNGGQRGKRNAGTALLLSVFVPGLGQFANGQVLKGGICLAIWLLSLIALNLSPEGKTLFTQFLGFMTGKMVRGANDYVSPLFWFLLLLVACVWVFSVADAAVNATRLNEETTGGDTGGVDRKLWEP